MIDATCVESHLRYPTSVKLLWESCTKVYELMQALRKGLKLRASRSNYNKHRLAFLNYQRTRKKTNRKEKKLRKQLLKYLLRLIQCFDELVNRQGCKLKAKNRKLISTIEKVYEQQHELTYGTQSVTDRIVSLHKPYLRPIVRGKETKRVEFGAKLHKLQVNGISFIEHLSYNNFNEGTRLKSSVAFHHKHFGKLSQLGADSIYATNQNRSYCNKLSIANSFVAKGNEGKLATQKQAMRSVLSTVRATVLEGSFGNEKNHYLLNKVKARNQNTELVWIFFGMMTANASIITGRMQQLSKRRCA